MENTPAIKDCNGRIITDSIEKGNSLNFYYSSLFSSDGNIPHILDENSVILSPLVLKSLGKGLQRLGKTNQQGQTVILEKL